VAEIVHECGAKLKFPAGMEGRKGRCPQCGLAVHVPLSAPGGKATSGAQPALKPASGTHAALPKASPVPQPPAPPAPGRSPTWRGDPTITLEPPENWASYEAYLDGKTEAPINAVIPANIMLRDEADAKWEAGMSKPPPSKYHCPGCKTRLDVGQLVCTGCGLDMRTGKSVDGKLRVSDEGEAYISKIPWVANARAGGDEGGEDDADGKKKAKFGNIGKRPGRG
jgi:hypothetical protein